MIHVTRGKHRTERIAERLIIQKGGDRMKVLAEHHWSQETVLIFVVLMGLSIGALFGWVLGSAMGNIGVGISLGILGGLIVGIVAGTMISDRAE